MGATKRHVFSPLIFHFPPKLCYNNTMYRLSLIISEIYNKYLPLAEKDGIVLNLDFSDTTKEVSDPERVKQYLDEHLDSALKRSDKGEITIGVDKGAITITDSGTTLSRSACALLSNRYIDVSSRVGFGTTIKIFLQPREQSAKDPQPKTPIELESVAVSAALDKTAAEPAAQGEVKLAAKQGKKKLGFGARLRLKGKKSAQTHSTIKTTPKPKVKAKPTKKTSRQLAAAARKADREVKRIAKKASKQNQKASKQSKKANKQNKKAQKPATKTSSKRKSKRLELS